MGFQFSVFVLFNLVLQISIVHLTFAGQQIHEFSQSDYSNKNNDGKQQANLITLQKSTTSKESSYFKSNQQQDEQIPVRWRTTSNYKLDARNDIRTSIDQTESSNYIETKHEELRKRTIRMRSLTSQQNELRKQLESNETLLNERIRTNNLEIRSIKMLVSAIRNCIQKFDRIQNELQKLYRDQIYTEKQLLDHYRAIRPADLDLHKQLKNAVERWELIYNQLLDMQLNEKQKNQDREDKFEELLNKLEHLQNKQTDYFSPESQSILQTSSSSNFYPISKQKTSVNSSPISSQQTSKLPSLLSSSSYTSSSGSTYSSSLKSTGTDQNPVYFSSFQTTDKTQDLNNKINSQEGNSLIFRRPEVLSEFKDIKCLSKWFEDLGKEDADWIARNQLNNERFFEELVRLQKAQWDKLYEQHNEKKQQSIPQTFKCEFDKRDLCEQEEENFKKKFNEYRIERYPTKLDQNQLSFNQQQNKHPSIGYSSNHKSQQISYNTND